MKYSHSKAMAVFYKIVKLVKLLSETHFSPTWRFFKSSLSPARTRFKEIAKWAKIEFL
jgi:hypothetical protein